MNDLQKPSSIIRLHCGNSTTEAKALGCIYDTLGGYWIPEPCFDNETTTAYHTSGQSIAYSEKDGTERLPLEAMGEVLYWTTNHDHLKHCAYMWQRQHKLFMNGGLRMDPMTMSYKHTVHCSLLLLEKVASDPRDLEEVAVATYPFFATCEISAEELDRFKD
jgi:hypothetical protein